MKWSRDPARRGIWSERLRRYANSGSTIAAFCERERVSIQSFYYWRRKLLGPGGTAGGGNGRMPRVGRVPQKRDFVPIAIRNSAAVRMRLPNGAQLWLPAGDAALVSAAIAAAGRLETSLQEDDAC
jgi:hypothetical protein